MVLVLIRFVHCMLFVSSQCLEVLGKEKFDKVQRYCERNGVPEMRYYIHYCVFEGKPSCFCNEL